MDPITEIVADRTTAHILAEAVHLARTAIIKLAHLPATVGMLGDSRPGGHWTRP